MPRAQKKYHFIYKTTNLLNCRFYIGMHSTNDLEDGYLGSGKRLRYSIKKYGKENHEVEILEYLEDRKSLAKREKEIVNEQFLSNPSCMNLAVGGEGGFDHITKEQRRANGIKCGGWKGYHAKYRNDPEYKKQRDKKNSESYKKYLESNDPSFLGKKHSAESKKLMGISHIGKHEGESNSQFGTCWIYSNELEISKKILKNTLDTFIEEGWIKGRKKFS